MANKGLIAKFYQRPAKKPPTSALSQSQAETPPSVNSPPKEKNQTPTTEKKPETKPEQHDGLGLRVGLLVHMPSTPVVNLEQVGDNKPVDNKTGTDFNSNDVNTQLSSTETSTSKTTSSNMDIDAPSNLSSVNDRNTLDRSDGATYSPLGPLKELGIQIHHGMLTPFPVGILLINSTESTSHKSPKIEQNEHSSKNQESAPKTTETIPHVSSAITDIPKNPMEIVINKNVRGATGNVGSPLKDPLITNEGSQLSREKPLSERKSPGNPPVTVSTSEETFMEVDTEEPVDLVKKKKSKEKTTAATTTTLNTDINNDRSPLKKSPTPSTGTVTVTTTTTSPNTDPSPKPTPPTVPGVKNKPKTTPTKTPQAVPSATPTVNTPVLADSVKLNVSEFVSTALQNFLKIPAVAPLPNNDEYSVLKDLFYLYSAGFMYRYYLENTPPNDIKNDDDFMQAIISCCAAGSVKNHKPSSDGSQFSLYNVTMENSVPVYAGNDVSPESIRQGEAVRELLCETFGSSSVRGALFLMNEMYFYKSLLEYHAKISVPRTTTSRQTDTAYEKLLTDSSRIIPSPFQYLTSLFKKVLCPATTNIVDYLNETSKKRNRFWQSLQNMMTFFGKYRVNTGLLATRLGFPKFVLAPSEKAAPCMISCFPQMVEGLPLLVTSSTPVSNDSDNNKDQMEIDNKTNSSDNNNGESQNTTENPFKPPLASMNISLSSDGTLPGDSTDDQKTCFEKLPFLCGLFSCNDRKDEILEFMGFPLLRMIGSLFCQPYSMAMHLHEIVPMEDSMVKRIRNGFVGKSFVSPTRLNALLNEITANFRSSLGVGSSSNPSDASSGGPTSGEFSLIDKSVLFSSETLLSDLWRVLEASCSTQIKDQLVFPNSASVFNRGDLIQKKKRKNASDKFGSGIPGLWYSLVGGNSNSSSLFPRINVAEFTKAVREFCTAPSELSSYNNTTEEGDPSGTSVTFGNTVTLSNWDIVDLPDHGIFDVNVNGLISFLNILYKELSSLKKVTGKEVPFAYEPQKLKDGKYIILGKKLRGDQTIEALFEDKNQVISLVEYLTSLKEKILDSEQNSREYKASLVAIDGAKAKNLRTTTETMTSYKNRSTFLNESSSVIAAVPSISQISVTKKTLAKCWPSNLSQVTTSSSETAMPFCNVFSGKIISKLVYFLAKAPLLFIRNFRIELPDIAHPSDSTETSTHIFKILADPNFIKMFFYDFFNWHSAMTLTKSVIFQLFFQMNGQILKFTDSPSSIKKFNMRQKRGSSGQGVQKVKFVSANDRDNNVKSSGGDNADDDDDNEDKNSDSRDEDETDKDIGDEEYTPKAYDQHQKGQKKVVGSVQDSDEEMVLEEERENEEENIEESVDSSLVPEEEEEEAEEEDNELNEEEEED